MNGGMIDSAIALNRMVLDGIVVNRLSSYGGQKLEGGREVGEKCVPGRRNLGHG